MQETAGSLGESTEPVIPAKPSRQIGPGLRHGSGAVYTPPRIGNIGTQLWRTSLIGIMIQAAINVLEDESNARQKDKLII